MSSHGRERAGSVDVEELGGVHQGVAEVGTGRSLGIGTTDQGGLAGQEPPGRLGLGWWRDQGGSLPVPGVVAWASIALIAAGMVWLARTTRRTIAADRAALDPQQAVTRLLLGKTSQVAGALLLGAYGALAWVAVDGLPAPLAVERLVHAGAACAAASVIAPRIPAQTSTPPSRQPNGAVRR